MSAYEDSYLCPADLTQEQSAQINWFTPQSIPHVNRMIVCCDGTWNTEENETNVTRLAKYIQEGPVTAAVDQICVRLDGVGTKSYGKRLKLPSVLDRVKGGVSGHGRIQLAPTIVIFISLLMAVVAGLEAKIKEAYLFICANWSLRHSYNEIILVGFSRGAFIARCIASLIRDRGILPLAQLGGPGDTSLWQEYGADFTSAVTNTYSGLLDAVKPIILGEPPGLPLPSGTPSSSRRRTVEMYNSPVKTERREEKNPHVVDQWEAEGDSNQHEYGHALAQYAEVKVLAVFDTVSAMGKAKSGSGAHRFDYVRANPGNIARYIFQALAINEHRADFRPEIWDDSDSTSGDGAVIRQTWFPGFHADVGGEKGSGNSVRDLSLLWMMDQLRGHVVFDEASALIDICREKFHWPGKFPDPYHYKWLRLVYTARGSVPRSVAPLPQITIHWCLDRYKKALRASGCKTMSFSGLRREPGEADRPGSLDAAAWTTPAVGEGGAPGSIPEEPLHWDSLQWKWLRDRQLYDSVIPDSWAQAFHGADPDPVDEDENDALSQPPLSNDEALVQNLQSMQLHQDSFSLQNPNVTDAPNEYLNGYLDGSSLYDQWASYDEQPASQFYPQQDAVDYEDPQVEATSNSQTTPQRRPAIPTSDHTRRRRRHHNLRYTH